MTTGNQEGGPDTGMIRFNTGMYGAALANFALVFEAMQNELKLAVQANNYLQDRLAQAEERAELATQLENQAKEHEGRVQSLHIEINQLRIKLLEKQALSRKRAR